MKRSEEESSSRHHHNAKHRSHTASRNQDRRSGGGHQGKSTGAQSQTPLLFFAGNAKLKPFVPSTEQRRVGGGKNRSSKGLGIATTAKSEMGESLMKRGRKNDFAFLTDDAEVREWEANQEELDRRWYDADEDGYGRADDFDDYFQNEQ